LKLNTSGLGKGEREKLMLIGSVTKAGSLPVLQRPKKEKVVPISITVNIGYGKNVIFKSSCNILTLKLV
jgi:hypothetical protein